VRALNPGLSASGSVARRWLGRRPRRLSRLNSGLGSAAPPRNRPRGPSRQARIILGVGPVYPTGTKPTAKPVTLEYVRWAAANIRIPWFAIGVSI